MIYDYINLDKSLKQPMYIQLYSNIKENIQNGNINKNSKLPSIRKLAEDLKVSKTTVENAYLQLCAEGYINNKPQSGYYVAQLTINSSIQNNIESSNNNLSVSDKYWYDFSGRSVDIGETSLKLWKKYIRYILNCDYLVTSYGDPQGELALREALSEYSYGVRGAVANSDEIIIGAGIQSLLYLLCGLLRKNYGNVVAVDEYGFSYAEKVFDDCGLKAVKAICDNNGIIPEELEKSEVRILLLNPSGNLHTGKPLKADRRTQLLSWAEKYNAIIIEDDYNGELKYSTHPVPAMQGYNKNRVVYLGSFSKLLLPSVRISYMILPPALLYQYKLNKANYNQTASKMEQLALGKYIADGQMERSLRRLRKIYKEKSEYMINLLKENFSDNVEIIFKETLLCLSLIFPKKTDLSDIREILKAKGVNVIFNSYNKNIIELSFSGIDKENIKKGIQVIKETIKSFTK